MDARRLVVATLAGPLATASCTQSAYVTNYNANTVSVIDTATNMVVATVGVGTKPIAVALAPDGKHAYVLNQSTSSDVSVIDTASNTVVATIPVPAAGGGLTSVGVAPDGKHAYVTTVNPTITTLS